MLASRSRAADERLGAAVRDVLLVRGYDAAQSMQLADIRDPAALEALALAFAVARAHVEFQRARGRIVRADGFEWSIGPGLASLGESVGARTVLIVSGYRARPTANRVVSQTLLSAAAIALTPLFVLPGVSMSASTVALLVEAKSGAVLWASEVSGSGAEPDRDGEAMELATRALETFPMPSAVTESSP